MRALIWKHGPGVAALLACTGLFWWGWKPVLLAAVAVVVAWVDGYTIGKEDSK